MTPEEKMLDTAKDAGCPQDQVENFLNGSYVPLPWQWGFHAACREADKDNGPVDIGLGGARGPGKSHAVLAQVGLDDCQRQPNLKVLFLRKTGASAQESFTDVIDKVLKGKVPYEYVNNTLKFPNGSKVILGGFRDERDIDKYIGIEYDVQVIEELNQVTKDRVTKLKGSLRTSKPNWRPRLYSSFNPGGIGHQYIKSHYVEPQRASLENETRFIPSTYESNVYLHKEYTEYLEGLEGDLGKAWREGEWDLFAGQFFSTWNYKTHVCEPFEIPKTWKKVVSMDYGYAAPSSVGWWAISPDNIVYRYRELYGPGMSYKQLTERILELTPDDEMISYYVGDPAMWAKKDSDISGIELMKARYRELQRDKNRARPVDLQALPQEMNIIKGVNDRMPGWNVFREYLTPFPDENEKPTARMQIFSTCADFIRTVPSLVHDEHKVEDLDSDLEDHAADESRYFLMSRPVPHEARNELDDRYFQERMRVKKLKRTKAGAAHKAKSFYA